MTEFARLGEMRRSIEQTALFDQPGGHYATGFIRGLNKSFARTGVGVYEVVTAPFPPYDPVFTDYLSPNPVYPDNYRPDIIDDSPVCDRHQHGLQRRRRSALYSGQPVQDLQHSLTSLPDTDRSSASIPVLALFLCRQLFVSFARFVANQWACLWKNNRPAKSTCC